MAHIDLSSALPGLLTLSWLLMGCSVPAPLEPKIASASKEASRQLQLISLQRGFSARLWAAEPLLANPVALWVDVRGRLFVAETFRQETRGVPDNRSHPEWLDDDLASQTVSDRRNMYLRHHPEYAHTWTQEQDRLRLLEDRDGDGRADTSSVFAGGFNDLLAGTGAGVLVRGGDVYYTCIPHLWHLRDDDGDGKADVRQSLHEGFGVRVALRGHDMHGLRFGPDGRLYFSIGDRGYDVSTPQGRLHDPRSGAVFRCNPDGSQLEVFATGLRNPQELVFDEFGNLFTGDNNSDAGDRARVVYVVEGSDAGWRMNFQYLPQRGPWMREGWSLPQHENQAAFLIPPLFPLGSGPAGLTHDPGVGLPPRLQGSFFLCDFLGGRQQSGVRSFQLKPRGAGFALRGTSWFVRHVLATDVDFGPDSALYISDWVEGWVGVGKGRILRVSALQEQGSRLVLETTRLLRQGARQLTPHKLVKLLSHQDQRVRLMAQQELVARGRGERPRLLRLALSAGPTLARLHALWALEQLARGQPDQLPEILPLLKDSDPEVRAQSAKVLGQVGCSAARPRLARMLRDPYPRSIFFAAMALGHVGQARTVPALLELLRRNRDRDVYLRHAAVMALTRIARRSGTEALWSRLRQASTAQRLGMVLVLRRLQDVRVAEFLQDGSPRVAAEAARAIYDVPLKAALPALADQIRRPDLETRPRLRGAPFLRRVLGANDLLSGARRAADLAAYAARAGAPQDLRALALQILARWDPAPRRDLILNFTRPRPPRKRSELVVALAGRLPDLIQRAPDPVRLAACDLAGRQAMPVATKALLELFHDHAAHSRPRRAALAALRRLRVSDLGNLAAEALATRSARLRALGADMLADEDPAQAVVVLTNSLKSGTTLEQQLALKTLGRMNDRASEDLLAAWMGQVLSHDVPATLFLDVLLAARVRKRHGSTSMRELLGQYDQSLPKKDALVRRLPCLEGGNARRGRDVFRRSALSCTRCHSLKGRRPEQAGPDLADLGLRRDRRSILTSIVDPSREIAPGFQSVLVTTEEDDDHAGVVLKETPELLVIEINETGSPERLEIRKSTITSRSKGKSSMPEDLAARIPMPDLRDLVEFLARQRGYVDTDHDPLADEDQR